jgi:DNA-directed RNA polymerase specialized sigma24 family protein
MTGDVDQAELIEACTMSSAKTFLDLSEGPLGIPITPTMRERVIDRQLMIQLRAWIQFVGLHLSLDDVPAVTAAGHSVAAIDATSQEVRTALLKMPASERLVYILHWCSGYAYERIDVMLNLGDPILAHEAAYVALHMLREKLQEAVN